MSHSEEDHCRLALVSGIPELLEVDRAEVMDSHSYNRTQSHGVAGVHQSGSRWTPPLEVLGVAKWREDRSVGHEHCG